jgi:putative membrane protein
LWLGVIAVSLSVGCSKAERTTADTAERPSGGAAVGTGGVAKNVRSDSDFVPDVATGNVAIIELSRMAVDKGTSAEVKMFAQRVIEEQRAAGDKLKNVISGQPIDWPAGLDDAHRKTVDELAKAQGADFDREYAKAMVASYQNLVAKLESRLDVQSLADWKTAAAGRTQDKAMPEPKVEMRDVQVRPEKSDRQITTNVNQWAADTYVVAQKHLDSARTLENATKKN